MKYMLIQSIYLLLSFPSQLFPALTESSQTTNGQKCSFYEIESHKIRYFLSLLLLAGMTPWIVMFQMLAQANTESGFFLINVNHYLGFIKAFKYSVTGDIFTIPNILIPSFVTKSVNWIMIFMEWPCPNIQWLATYRTSDSQGSVQRLAPVKSWIDFGIIWYLEEDTLTFASSS